MSNTINILMEEIKILSNTLKQNTIVEKDDETKLLNLRIVSGLNFCVAVLNDECVSYPSMGKFQEIMNLLDSLFKQLALTNYEKGKIIRKFLNVAFANEANNKIISVNYEEAYDIFNKKQKISLNKIKKYLKKYGDNPDDSDIPLEMKDDIASFFKKTEDDNALFEKRYVEFQSKYLSVNDDYDFEGLKEGLQYLFIPEKIASSYYSYVREVYVKKQTKKSSFIYLEKDVKIKEEEKYSKKELKSKLNSCCDLSNNKSFSYKDYERLLWILSKLQYADTVNDSYFNYCYQNRVEDNYYYRFVFEKLKSDKKYKDIMEDILFYLDSMFICSEEDYVVAKEEILKLLNSVGVDTILNFDIEMTRVRKK